MNINSDSKPVAKMANVLKRFKVPLYLGMNATVVWRRDCPILLAMFQEGW